MSADTTSALARAYVDALRSAQFDDVAMASDVTFRGPRLGPVVGRDEVRELLTGIARAFASFEVTELDVLVDGDEAVALLSVTLPDGRAFDIADHLRFRAGELVFLRPYFDAGILEQAGAAPSVADLGPSAHL